MIAVMVSLSALAKVWVNLGLDTAIKVLIPGLPDKQRAREFWGLAQSAVLIAIFAYVLMAILYPFFREGLIPPEITYDFFLVGLMLFPLNVLFNLLQAQLTTHRNAQAISRVMIRSSLLEIALYILGAFWIGVTGVLFAMVIALAVRNLWLINGVLRKDKFSFFKPQMLPELKKFYFYGATLFFVGLAGWVVDSSDRLIISYYWDTSVLGVYDTVYSISNRVNGIVPIFAALLPFVSEALANNDQSGAQRYFLQTFKILLAFYFPVAIIMSITGRDILQLLTTSEFLSGAIYFPFVLTGILFSQVGGIYRYNLHAHKKSYLILVPVAAAGILNLGLNLLLIPSYGAIAAAASTTVAYIIIFFMDGYFSSKSLSLPLPYAFIVRILAAATITGVVVLLVHSSLAGAPLIARLVIAAITGGVVYSGAVYFFRAFSDNELQSIKSLAASLIRRKRS